MHILEMKILMEIFPQIYGYQLLSIITVTYQLLLQ